MADKITWIDSDNFELAEDATENTIPSMTLQKTEKEEIEDIFFEECFEKVTDTNSILLQINEELDFHIDYYKGQLLGFEEIFREHPEEKTEENMNSFSEYKKIVVLLERHKKLANAENIVSWFKQTIRDQVLNKIKREYIIKIVECQPYAEEIVDIVNSAAESLSEYLSNEVKKEFPDIYNSEAVPVTIN